MRNYILSILILITSCTTLSRWATEDDAPIVNEMYNAHLTINQDGSFEKTVEMKLLISKEQGRKIAANFPIIYNEEIENCTILEAKAITNGIEYMLDEDTMIENRELASNMHGFDRMRQIRLTFPNVEIGSSLFIKFNYVKKIPVISGYFAQTDLWDGLFKSIDIKVESSIPLYTQSNDPLNAFKIIQNKSNTTHTLQIKTIKPFFQNIVNEPGGSTLNPKNQSWISLSSLIRWEDLSIQFAPHYERVVNQDLPLEYEAIRAAAAQEENIVDQINTISSLLNEKVQYMSDMRTVAGRYFPHDLEKIIEHQLGDCKNFAVSAAAIIKKLGYKAQIALVHRGTNQLLITTNLPDINNFNHAIVKVTDGDGTVYWIDPTNPVSMVDGIFPDIAGKMALVLDTTEPSYEQIPDISPNHAQTIRHDEITIQDDTTLIHQGYIEYKGEDALELAGRGMYLSDEQLRDGIFQAIARTYLEPEAKIELVMPDLTSRLVSDFTISYSYCQDNGLIMTNFGYALFLNAQFTPNWNAAANYVGDLYLGTPGTVISHTLIKNTTADQIERLNFQVDTPWLSVKRFCTHEGANTRITETLVIKQTYISAEELRTQEYLELEKILQRNYKATVLIVRAYEAQKPSCSFID